jgi:hypothetical protein
MNSTGREEWLRRKTKVREALEVVLARLTRLQPAPEVDTLRQRAERALEAAQDER